jgi:protein-S-isoprenylcysteine O-methyltransferase Ste14
MVEIKKENIKKKRPSINQSGKKRIVQVLVWFVLSAVILFGCAGALDWLEAWIYLGGGVAVAVMMSLLVIRKNPEAINERGRKSANTKKWDRVLLGILTPLPILLMVLAGLDYRYAWSSVPLWAQALAFIVLVPGMFIPYLAMLNNPFLATTVRIEGERGHEVASEGPYRFVRHPMYTGIIMSWIAGPILLGSMWALVPGLLSTLLLVVRTLLEDRTLQEELAGYRDYVTQVRYRLVPGVW